MFTMYDYIEDIIGTTPFGMSSIASDTARTCLFYCGQIIILFNEKESDFSHSTTVRFLFTAKRARSDIQIAVTYLYTTIRAPAMSNYKKLITGVVKYLCLTEWPQS